MSHVAVIDIGKTNAKVALVDRGTLSEIAVVTRPNIVLAGPPWPHFDVEGHWDFLLNALSTLHVKHGIDAISITTHGASLALLAADGGLAAPVLDYEHTGPDQLSAEYDRIRPPFAETGSPRLGMGLNAGAQLFWQFRSDPGLLARIDRIVTYPQYWAFRLTGVAATEATSLGCHTDLWNPYRREFSSLAKRLGIRDKLASVRMAGDVLGPILPMIAEQTGLATDTPVHCGIHDSNASLLPHLLSRTAPYSVVSSGTWVIAMAVGGKEVELDATLDTLVNVNALGDPVRSARFMGGREYDLAMGRACPEPGERELRTVLKGRSMLLPALVSETGPFSGREASWLNEPPPGTAERAVAVGFYLALVTAHCLELVGHEGPVVLEGPFAKNQGYLRMLAAATGSDVLVTGGTTGTSQGAALLGAHSLPDGCVQTFVKAGGSDADKEWTGYRTEWNDRVFAASTA